MGSDVRHSIALTSYLFFDLMIDIYFYQFLENIKVVFKFMGLQFLWILLTFFIVQNILLVYMFSGLHFFPKKYGFSYNFNWFTSLQVYSYFNEISALQYFIALQVCRFTVIPKKYHLYDISLLLYMFTGLPFSSVFDWFTILQVYSFYVLLCQRFYILLDYRFCIKVNFHILLRIP